jgi:ABC-type lipoprotein export system ATPase subunit
MYLIQNHATVVIVGETGSGKTTQIPQILHEAGWTAGTASFSAFNSRLCSCGLNEVAFWQTSSKPSYFQ